MTDVVLLHLYLPSLDVSAFNDLDKAKSVRVQQLDRIVARMAGLRGVLDTGLVNAFPLTGAGSFGTFVVPDGLLEGRTEEDFTRLAKDPSRSGTAHYRVASEGYFRAMGIPLIRGRLFDERDTIGAQHVAVISETLARTQWPDRDPIGRRIQFGNMDGDPRLLTVVGIVGDVRDEGLDAAPAPTLYTCYRQRPQTGFRVVMHTANAPADLGRAVNAAAREVAPNIPTRFASIDELVGTWLGWRRTALVLLGVFAVTALLVAVAGLYGAMAYTVTQRTQEMGIRAALGADRGALLRLVLARGLVIVAGGVAIGVVSALALTGFLRSLLYGITSSDPFTLVTAALLLAIVAMAACYVPARRAARVDPVIALRAE